ncbi:MAG: hypothetical protein NWS24_05840 [Ilumatobacteraceae bacterium]|nr:hypothetical protein [Ilumatobacteraceae bacterium]MDP4703006.1 hypothetical protein [Ilumatobacteraceae bacterium]
MARVESLTLFVVIWLMRVGFVSEWAGEIPSSTCGEGDEEIYDSIYWRPALCRIGRQFQLIHLASRHLGSKRVNNDNKHYNDGRS